MNGVVNNAAIASELLVEQDESVPNITDTSLEYRERSLRTKPTGAFLVARQMGKYPVALINGAPIYALSRPRHAIYKGLDFKSFAGYSVTKAGIHG